MDYSNQLFNRVNLKLLHTFMLVATFQNFREAATQAGRSQSAISAQIKQLEQQLGTTLIVRTTRSFRLTEEGALLLNQARRAMKELEYGLSYIAETAESRQTQVTLACSSAFAFTRLPEVIKAFRQEYPRAQVIMKEHKAAGIIDSVKHGEADIGVGPEVYDEDLAFRLIETEPLYAIAPKALVPRTQDTLPFAQLAQFPLIMFHQNTVIDRIVGRTARDLNIALNIEFRCIQGQTLVALAEAGLGICIVTESSADISRLKRAKRLLLSEPRLYRHLAAITLRHKVLSPAAQRLYDLIVRHTSDHTWNAPARPTPLRNEAIDAQN